MSDNRYYQIIIVSLVPVWAMVSIVLLTLAETQPAIKYVIIAAAICWSLTQMTLISILDALRSERIVINVNQEVKQSLD